MKRCRVIIALIGLAAAFTMPLFFLLFKNISPLNGVSYSANKDNITVSGLWEGGTQSEISNLISENLPGRDAMIRVRNQGIFSLFDKSTNAAVVLGENGVLFEREYVYKYEAISWPVTQDEAHELCSRISSLDSLLSEKGKKLYVFITPSKVRYFENCVPEKYRKAARYRDMDSSYTVFKNALKNTDIKTFDSIEYIDQLIASGDKVTEFPLYQPTGTHWAWPLSQKVALAFADFIEADYGECFPEASETIAPSEKPFFPDSDIYDIMNILRKPGGNYFTADIILDDEAVDAVRPDVLAQGGSFMGQTIGSLINKGYFENDAYIENTTASHNRFSTTQSFSDFSELDLKTDLETADMVILEVNESKIEQMSFGFMDYLISHPELLE